MLAISDSIDWIPPQSSLSALTSHILYPAVFFSPPTRWDLLCSGLKGCGKMENGDARRAQGSFPFSKEESENQKGFTSRTGFATLQGLPSVISFSLRWWCSQMLSEQSILALAMHRNHLGMCPKS